MVNLAARNKELERPLLAGHRKKVERPPRPNAARDSHNTERKREKKNHHRQAHSNFGAICNSGWRFTETPYKFGISRYINSAICAAFNAAPLSN